MQRVPSAIIYGGGGSAAAATLSHVLLPVDMLVPQ